MHQDIRIAQLERALMIEASLERVRSASMSMRKSEGLIKVATIMYEEFKKLGMTQSASARFGLIDEETKLQYMWGAQTDNGLLHYFTLPLLGDQVLQDRYDAWKSKKPLFRQKLSAQELKKHLEVAMPIAQTTEEEERSKTAMPDPTYFFFGNFKQGYLQIISAEALSEEHQALLPRFAKVFEQTYTRFVDLQKAEDQALRLQEIDNAKTNFYTNITHEFRTLLTIILGMADQLKTQVYESGKVGLEMIDRNGRQLLRLVNQMLDLHKLESKSMSINMIQGDILTYLKYLVESFHSYAATKNIRVQFLTDLEELQVDYDPEKIQHIVSNLLSNAIKFSPKGGEVSLEISQQAKHFHLSVKDSGIGISEDKMDRIFDRFYQVEGSNTRHAEGTGVGLALTRELVHLLKGKITVKSQLGKGSEFIVRLPITRQSKFSQEKPSVAVIAPKSTDKPTVDNTNPQPGSQKKYLLIIEDNVDVVHYLKSCLKNSYLLDVAYDGQEGIDKAKATIPDLIISDIMMPLVDGFEVCNSLKNDIRTSHIPILLLTAKVDLNSRLQGIDQGADAYLAKPFIVDELLANLNALWKQRNRLQEHYLQLYNTTSNSKMLNPAIKGKKESEFIEKVKEKIHTNLANPNFGVEQLSRYLSISSTQMYRKLKAQTGCSAQELIRSIRLHHAQILLKSSQNSIAEIAYSTGFSEPDYFSKVFKKEFGMRPSAYRKLPNFSK